MNFLIDRSFPLRVMQCLAILEGRKHTFTYLDEHFPQDTIDTVWLKGVGSWNPKPIILSGDGKILSKRDEIQELMKQDLFFVTMYGNWLEHSIYEQMWKFVKAWPTILKELEHCKVPTVLRVVPSGNNVENLGATAKFKK